MAKHKKGRKKAQKALDTFSPKRGRGRPGVRKSEIQGWANDSGLIMEHYWGEFSEAFLKARTEEEFNTAFKKLPEYVQRKFQKDLFALVKKVRRDPKFPKKETTQRTFFAESLAGEGRISPRRSRDIVAEGRKKIVHYIKRRDFYIECTCGYEGPASYGKCPNCETSRVAIQTPPIPGIEED